MKKKYYEIHVFFTREDGYSFTIESNRELTDDEAIELAVAQDKFTEDGDQHLVDRVSDLDEEEFLSFNNNNE